MTTTRQITLAFGVLLAFLATALPGDARPQPGVTESVVKLTLHPTSFRLDDARDRSRVIVVAHFADGTTRDVTGEARVWVRRPGLAEVEGGRVRPLAAGKSALSAEWEGQSVHAPFEVVEAEAVPPVSFHREVIPVLTRAGCNSGGCHGSAVGKNGFALSLFGFDPEADHERLTRELRGRRIDPADPVASLLLTKPTTQVVHKGGRRLEKGAPLYETLVSWIREGASFDAPDKAKLVRLEVGPPQMVFSKGEQTQRMVVRAIHADGSDRDVTELALMSSTNPAIADVDDEGLVTSGRHGEAFVLVRFGTIAEVAQVIVVDGERPARPAVTEGASDIDRLVEDKLAKLRLDPAPSCDDGTFIRRVTLDVLGVLPTIRETEAFLADARPDKRARLVDALLARPEFPDVLAMQWAEVLRVESDKLEKKGMQVYTDFLRDAFREDVPFDEVVRRLLTANGPSFTTPESNFYLAERDPKAIAENVSQVFLGIRVQCAQCHNHPFERWTMDDYYGFAAFFSQIGYKRGEDPREWVVFDRRGGQMRHPKGNRVVSPRFLGGEAPQVKRGRDLRDVLAQWMTAKDNAWFATNIANRIWARFFGRGIVEPVDDVRVSNPPSHPELHRLLGRKLAASGFDIRGLIREICASRTYQRATLVGEEGTTPVNADPAALAGAPVRRLSAEQLLDAIGLVTGLPSKYRGLPLGARASQVTDGNPANYFLDVFGRPRRTSSCACERRSEPTLSQTLHLINGPTIEAKIRDPKGRLARRLAEKATDQAMLEELWMLAYCRKPSATETEKILGSIKKASDRTAIWEDVYWAVLNSREFVFNH